MYVRRQTDKLRSGLLLDNKRAITTAVIPVSLLITPLVY